ncbi:hypothetical protein T492DRAFT_1142402, partial [Pavlovales sp. CCMP2436]
VALHPPASLSATRRARAVLCGREREVRESEKYAALFRHSIHRGLSLHLSRPGTVVHDPACAAAAPVIKEFLEASISSPESTSDETSPPSNEEILPSHHLESGSDAVGEEVRGAGDLFGEDTVSGPAADGCRQRPRQRAQRVLDD